jgi:hypothetical protein
VVKRLTPNLKIKCTNPATSTRRKKMAVKSFVVKVCPGSTVVKCLTDNPEIKCLNPAASTRRKKMTGKSFVVLLPERISSPLVVGGEHQISGQVVAALLTCGQCH